MYIYNFARIWLKIFYIDIDINVDLYNDVNAEISEESSEEDEPPKDGGSEPNEDIDDIRDFSQNGVNLHNHDQGVSHDIPISGY